MILTSVLQAMGLFAATNIDDIIVLSLFFARGAGQRGTTARILAGQYLGFAGILGAAVLVTIGAGAFLPSAAIPYFGLIPLGLGLWAAWQAWHGDGDDDDDEAKVAGKKVGMWTVAGVTLANGGDNIGSDRNGPMGPPPQHWPALKGNPAELTIYDYVQRADDSRGIATLKGRKLTMIGFVSAAPEDPDHAWVLARLKMWCCVADALPFMTTMVDAPSRPTDGSWIRVTGTYLPSSANGDTRFKVDRVEKIPVPENPYT